MKYIDLNGIVSADVNISENERFISGITGGLLLAMGIFDFRKSSFRRIIRLTAGSIFIIRGISGYCPLTAIKHKKLTGIEVRPPNFISG
jgi:uncharacterized membrane protein